MKPIYSTIGVVGTGAMGRGIAQIAAQAGSTVKLYDTQAPAITQAIDSLSAQWTKLAEKGKLTSEQVQANVSRLQGVHSLQDLADCQFVIEAIVERLDVKQSLFGELEGLSLIHI